MNKKYNKYINNFLKIQIKKTNFLKNNLLYTNSKSFYFFLNKSNIYYNSNYFKTFFKKYSNFVISIFFFELKSYFYIDNSYFSKFSNFNSIIFNFSHITIKSTRSKLSIFKKNYIIFYFDNNLRNLNHINLFYSPVVSIYNFESFGIQPTIYLPYHYLGYFTIYGFMSLMWLLKSVFIFKKLLFYKNILLYFKINLIKFQ